MPEKSRSGYSRAPLTCEISFTYVQAATLEGSHMLIWTWNLQGHFPACRIKTVLRKKGVKLGCICSSWLNYLYMHMATCLQPVSTVVYPFVKAMFLLETMRHCFKHLWGLWGVYVCVCMCLHVYVCVWSDRWDLCCAESFFLKAHKSVSHDSGLRRWRISWKERPCIWVQSLGASTRAFNILSNGSERTKQGCTAASVRWMKKKFLWWDPSWWCWIAAAEAVGAAPPWCPDVLPA